MRSKLSERGADPDALAGDGAPAEEDGTEAVRRGMKIA